MTGGNDGPRLTGRELECLRWTAAGKTVSEIAIILGISRHTVRGYMKEIHRKLNCLTMAQAVLRATELGILELK